MPRTKSTDAEPLDAMAAIEAAPEGGEFNPAGDPAADMPLPPYVPGYPEPAPDQPVQIVELIGGGPADGAYMAGKPIPQDIAAGSAIYNLSDRAAGLYTFRVK